MSNLFSSLSIKNVRFKNRVVLPPMVCFNWSDDAGVVSARHVAHYRRRAAGGCGLIIVEAHAVSERGRLNHSQLGLWSDGHVAGLAKIVRACHKHGASVLVQINHAGFKTPTTIASPALAPTDYRDGSKHAGAMTLVEIRKTQEAFVAAARRAKESGCDGVELHGAHGYLINQFMSPLANRRDDRYGGDLTARTTFAREIIEGLKEQVVDDDFVLGYRMGGNEPGLKEGTEIARLLEKAGVELLHVSSGFSEEDHPQAPSDFPYHWIVYLGTEIKKHVGIPVISVCRIRTPQEAEWLVGNAVDLVAIGRGQLVEPDWAKKARSGEELITCLDCKPSCPWSDDSSQCPRYDHELYEKHRTAR